MVLATLWRVPLATDHAKRRATHGNCQAIFIFGIWIALVIAIFVL